MKTILFSGHDLKFLTHVIDHFKNKPEFNVLVDELPGHDLTDKKKAKLLLRKADVIFCEWALGNAVWYSKNKAAHQILIIRLHHQELNLEYLHSINYSNVDKMVFICPENLQVFLLRFPDKEPLCQLIYNVIDCNTLDQPKLPGALFNLGFIGSSPKRKAPHHALSILKKLRKTDKRYSLSFKGKHPWEYSWLWKRKEEREYYANLYNEIESSEFSNSILFDKHGKDIPDWFTRIGFILSTSDHEGSHQAVAEGMASGSIPVIRNWDGAEKIYPEEFIVKSEDEAVSLILRFANNDDSRTAAALVKGYARKKFDIPVIIQEYEKLIEELLQKHENKKDTTVKSKTKSIGHENLPLKVVHLCYLKPGNQSGYETRVIEEVKTLVRSGVEVILVVFVSPNHFHDQALVLHHRKTLSNETKAKVFYFPTRHFFSIDNDNPQREIEIDNQVLDIITQHQVKIIHGQALYASYHALRIAEIVDLKVVFDNHGVSPEENEMTGIPANRIAQLTNIEEKVLNNADLIIMVSKKMAHYYKEKYDFEGLNQQVIPCCVDSKNFILTQEEREEVRTAKGFNKKFVLAYVGTLSVWQWPEAIFKLFDCVRRNFSQSFLYLLIPQYDHEKATQLINNYKLSGDSCLLEEVPHNQISKIIGAADVGILLRKDNPVNLVSSPTKFGEYLAAGVPVIISDGIGDYSELTRNEMIGQVVKMHQESAKVINEEELTEYLKGLIDNPRDVRLKCRKVASLKLSWNSYGEKMHQWYSQFVR